MSEVGRRPEQTPSFQRKVEQTDTQKHKGEHTSTAGLGWAGLGWAGAAGGGGGLTEAPPPRGVSLDNDPSHSEGKGPGAGNRSHDSKFEPSEDSGS